MNPLLWAAAGYLLVLVGGYYSGVGDVRRHHLESASFIYVAAILLVVTARRGGDQAQRATSAPDPWWARTRFVGLAFLLAAVIVYRPVFAAGAFADDYVLIEAARQGRWTVWAELFRPVIFFVWRVVDAVSPDPVASVHVLNVILHAANATMTAALARRLGVHSAGSMLAGALFLCFPASVEPVAWSAGIQDVLMTTFALGFVVLISGARTSIAGSIAAVVLLVAACLTKESGATAIVLAGLVLMVIRPPRRAWVTLGLAASLLMVLLAVRLWLLPLPSSYGNVSSRYDVKELLVRPFATLAVPFRESEAVAAPWTTIASVAVVVVGLGWSAMRWHRRSHDFHLAVFGGAFVLASIAAVNTTFFVTADLLGSRYLYLGCVGWSIVLAAVVGEVGSRFRMVAAALVFVIAVCWLPATRAHVALWTQAAESRETILHAAAHTTASACQEIAVDGLPQTVAGVPVFVNGFPEAMRERRSDVTFRVALPGERFDCRLVWTGSDFRKR